MLEPPKAMARVHFFTIWTIPTWRSGWQAAHQPRQIPPTMDHGTAWHSLAFRGLRVVLDQGNVGTK